MISLNKLHLIDSTGRIVANIDAERCTAQKAMELLSFGYSIQQPKQAGG